MLPSFKNPLAACGLAFALSVTLVTAHAAEKKKFQVEETTIAQIQDAILKKELTATELVKIYLTRIKTYNGQPVEYGQPLFAIRPRK